MSNNSDIKAGERTQKEAQPTPHLENLTVAAQAAALLASDIASAHGATCVEGGGALNPLLGDALLPLIGEARALQQKLERLVGILSQP